jgi:flagellar hook-length control protein FliK
MEQMNTMLAVPTVSNSTPVSTSKTILPANQESFASVYKRNISESDSSASTTKDTKVEENTKPNPESKTEEDSKLSKDTIKESGETTEVTEVVQPSLPTGIAWQSILEVIPLPTEIVQAETGITVEGVDSNINVKTGSLIPVTTTVLPEAQSLVQQKVVDTTISSEVVDLPEAATSAQTNITAALPIATASTESQVGNTAEVVETDSKISGISEIKKDTAAVTSTPIQNIDTKVQTVKSTFEPVIGTIGKENTIPLSTKESVLNQIQETLGKVVKSGENEIRLQLSPENLGVLNIRIIAGKEGTQVLFKTDNLHSSQLISGQVDTLKAMMIEAGIKVDQVLVSDFSFSQQSFANQEQTNQQNFRPYTKNSLMTAEQSEQWENPYELPQSIVGLNYLA